MKLKVVVEEGAFMPTKAYESDAGFDLYSREAKVVPSKSSAIFNTGIHIQIPSGMVGFLKSKSGLNVKHNIQSEGVIDSGYNGSIIVKLYNQGEKDYIVESGDKISQLVMLPIPPIELQQVKSLEESDRGSKGFGSSGK